MNRFWDLLEELKGVKPHRLDKDSGSTMGGWYNARGLYVPDELNGLPVARFCEAVTAEGVPSVGPGCNFPLHLHPVLNEADVYGHGKPTRIANAACDVRQPKGSLPVSESILDHCLGVPWFKHDRPDYITQCASAFRKVIENAESL